MSLYYKFDKCLYDSTSGDDFLSLMFVLTESEQENRKLTVLLEEKTKKLIEYEKRLNELDKKTR